MKAASAFGKIGLIAALRTKRTGCCCTESEPWTVFDTAVHLRRLGKIFALRSLQEPNNSTIQITVSIPGCKKHQFWTLVPRNLTLSWTAAWPCKGDRLHVFEHPRR